MRSTMTAYGVGSAMRTSPTLTNSASMPGTRCELILSTRAGGKVFSMPKMTPIFFTVISVGLQEGARQEADADRDHRIVAQSAHLLSCSFSHWLIAESGSSSQGNEPMSE